MFSLILVHLGGSPINPRCHVFVDFNESQFGLNTTYTEEAGGVGVWGGYYSLPSKAIYLGPIGVEYSIQGM